MQRASGPRKTANLPESVHQRLSGYALAASAAAAGMLTATQPAQAKIIFKSTHHTITNGQLPIPVAGTSYFVLTDTSSRQFSYSRRVLDINAGGSASVVVQTSSASALMAGKVVGPTDQFRSGKNQMVDAFCDVSVGASSVLGPFANTVNRFLGLKFKLSGKIHYGWARFSKVTGAACNGGPAISATLTGYAYETIPNKPITTGKTKGPDVVVEPATLGALAIGRK